MKKTMKKTWTKKIRPIKRRGKIGIVPLTRGIEAIIDAKDIPLIAGWNWCAMPVSPDKWYAYTGGNRKMRMHQFLLGSPKKFIDHKDRNGLNNRRSNLRVVSHLQSARNRGIRKDTKTNFKGVGLRIENGRFRARIDIGKKRISLGSFSTAKEAALMYDKAAKKYFGKFAVLNFGNQNG